MVGYWLQSRFTFKKRTALGGKGGVIGKGKNEKTLRVAVEEVIHVYKPQRGASTEPRGSPSEKVR